MSEKLQEATLRALESKLNNSDKLINSLDILYTEIQSKLNDIIHKAYSNLIKLPIPKDCKSINMYYGSSIIYNYFRNDLELYEEEIVNNANLSRSRSFYLMWFESRRSLFSL